MAHAYGVTAVKLTRKQRRTLEHVLADAQRAQMFLHRADVAVGRVSQHATTTLHFTRADGQAFYAVDKHYGSDLVGLQSAIESLRAFLAEPVSPC